MRRLRKVLSFPLRLTSKRLYRRNVSVTILSVCLTALCWIVIPDLLYQQLTHLSSVNTLEGQGHGARVFSPGILSTDLRYMANCSLRALYGVPFASSETLHDLMQRKAKQTCVHPSLDPCGPDVMKFEHSVEPLSCSPNKNWVYVDNGTFQISTVARAKFGKITCEYAPLVRGRNDFSARHAEHIKPMASGTPLLTDFFKVACISPAGKRYHNIHAGVAYNQVFHERSESIPLPPKALGYSVFMLGFDSVSYMSWLRNLPRTRDFLVNELGAIELKGYNIVGDGTVQALLPILTGNTEHDLPTSRRGEPGATTVDDYPWIWNDYKKSGYVTAWAEDMSYIGTFQYRLNGFAQQPTDHSMRTYYMLAEPMYKHNPPFCLGSVPRHKVFLNWFRDLFLMYGNKPKFMFGFHSEYSHSKNVELKKMDQDLVDYLKFLQSSGYLDKTVLVMMSDHGTRFTNIRQTAQGKIEERMPYFAFRFPPGMEKSHPTAIRNFRINANRLTTPFDIHETFHDILSFNSPRTSHNRKRGLSLFKEVPAGRSCDDAEIMAHWCACLEWREVDPSVYLNVSSAVVAFINNLTSSQRHRCAPLRLKRVVSLALLTPNAQVLRFQQSGDLHGDVPEFAAHPKLELETFQVTLETEPGGGLFEVTVRHRVKEKEFDLSAREISRINRYGDAPACITKELPHLRPYCQCIHA